MLVIAMDSASHEFESVLERWRGGLRLLHAQSDDITVRGEGADLLLLTTPPPGRIVCDDAVFILQGGRGLPQRLCCKNCAVIVDSASESAREQASRRHIPALTCGLSRADTFSFTSITSDSAMLALSRPVLAFDGSTVEPFELPVELCGVREPFHLLSCAAALTMLGHKNPLLCE